MNLIGRNNDKCWYVSHACLCLVVAIGLCLPLTSWAGVDREFTEKSAKAYCQKSQVRKSVKAKTQNQCCAAVTKQCHESCSKQESGRIACSGGCSAAFEACWDTKEKSATFRAKWMYDYCKKRHRRVKTHNSCCRNMESKCGAACDYKYPPSQRGSCMDRCQKATDSCLRVSKSVKKKPFNPDWMNAYCADSKKRKKVKASDRHECCDTMYDRCWAACDGYQPNERNACKDRCSIALDRCEKG